MIHIADGFARIESSDLDQSELVGDEAIPLDEARAEIEANLVGIRPLAPWGPIVLELTTDSPAPGGTLLAEDVVRFGGQLYCFTQTPEAGFLLTLPPALYRVIVTAYNEDAVEEGSELTEGYSDFDSVDDPRAKDVEHITVSFLPAD